MTDVWQPAYALRDHEIVDYEYWELAGSGAHFRGPEHDFDDPAPYVACVGAAQTFGCFVARPYPTVLAEALDMRTVNLGLGSAVPSFFSSNDRLMEVINGSQVLVLQVMAARQEGNSRLAMRGTDLVHDRRHGDDVPAHLAWQRILDEEPANVDRYVTESQQSWIGHYRHLLEKVTVPVVLFYYSVRDKDFTVRRDAKLAHEMLEPFPQLVEGASVDTIAALCDRCVECTSVRNHKHPLTSRFTGEPVQVDNSVLDPRMQTRWKRNWYYPSPEMHEDAAAALLPTLAEFCTS